MKKWLIMTLIIVGLVIGGTLGVYFYNNNKTSNINTIEEQQLADVALTENSVNNLSTVETILLDTKISPNAIIIKKTYYKSCDHLIREVIDIPEELINKEKQDVENAYSGWKVEGYSPNEIVIYKQMEGMCGKHYVLKEHNGVIGIYVVDENNKMTLKEDTQIVTKYLPEADFEKLQTGIEAVGNEELNSLIEDFE